MKQEITITQLGKLSVQGLIRYREISKIKGWVSRHGETTWTIGQMIEFLDEFHLAMGVVKRSWLPTMDFRNLCDDLWSAVKERLEYQSPYLKEDNATQ